MEPGPVGPDSMCFRMVFSMRIYILSYLCAAAARCVFFDLRFRITKKQTIAMAAAQLPMARTGHRKGEELLCRDASRVKLVPAAVNTQQLPS